MSTGSELSIEPLHIYGHTNIKKGSGKPTLFTLSMFDVQITRKGVLEKYPCFTPYVEYPLSIIKRMSDEEILFFFFNIDRFRTVLLEGNPDIKSDIDETIAYNNMKITLSYLFLLNNRYKQSSIENGFSTNLQLTSVTTESNNYRHLNIEGISVTAYSGVLICDMFSHPDYNKLFKLVRVLDTQKKRNKHTMDSRKGNFISLIKDIFNILFGKFGDSSIRAGSTSFNEDYRELITSLFMNWRNLDTDESIKKQIDEWLNTLSTTLTTRIPNTETPEDAATIVKSLKDQLVGMLEIADKNFAKIDVVINGYPFSKSGPGRINLSNLSPITTSITEINKIVEKYNVTGASEYKTLPRLLREFKLGPRRMKRRISSNPVLQDKLNSCLVTQGDDDVAVDEEIKELYDNLSQLYRHYKAHSKDKKQGNVENKHLLDVGITTVYSGSTENIGSQSIEVESSYYEVHMYLECIQGKVTPENITRIGCLMKNYELGDDFVNLFFPVKKQLPWELSAVDREHIVSVEGKGGKGDKKSQPTDRRRDDRGYDERGDTEYRGDYRGRYDRGSDDKGRKTEPKKERDITAKTLDVWFVNVPVNFGDIDAKIDKISKGVYGPVNKGNLFSFMEYVIKLVTDKRYKYSNSARIKNFIRLTKKIYSLKGIEIGDPRKIELFGEIETLLKTFETYKTELSTKQDIYGKSEEDKNRQDTDIVIDELVIVILKGLNTVYGIRKTGGSKYRTKKNKNIRRRTRKRKHLDT